MVATVRDIMSRVVTFLPRTLLRSTPVPGFRAFIKEVDCVSNGYVKASHLFNADEFGIVGASKNQVTSSLCDKIVPKSSSFQINTESNSTELIYSKSFYL